MDQAEGIMSMQSDTLEMLINTVPEEHRRTIMDLKMETNRVMEAALKGDGSHLEAINRMNEKFKHLIADVSTGQ